LFSKGPHYEQDNGQNAQLQKSIEQLKPLAADKYIDILIIQGYQTENFKLSKFGNELGTE